MYSAHTLLVCCFGRRQQSTWTTYFKGGSNVNFIMTDLLISVPNFITLVKSYNLMQISTYNNQNEQYSLWCLLQISRFIKYFL